VIELLTSLQDINYNSYYTCTLSTKRDTKYTNIRVGTFIIHIEETRLIDTSNKLYALIFKHPGVCLNMSVVCGL